MDTSYTCHLPTFGQIQEFQADSETISAYVECIDVFYNTINVPEEKKMSVLLSVIGGKTYVLLRSLLSPDLPQRMSFQVLVETLKRHFEPKVHVIAKRFHFHQ